MMQGTLVTPGKPMAQLTVDTLDGQRASLGGEGWKLIVVYRGAHCPICKQYLSDLEERREGFEQLGLEVIAVSADQKERAEPFIKETGFTGQVGVGLSLEQMQTLGVYVSEPRSSEEAPAPFAEPALFVVNALGDLQFVDKSNAPFVRPDLEKVLSGIKYVLENDYPIRGTLAA